MALKQGKEAWEKCVAIKGNNVQKYLQNKLSAQPAIWLPHAQAKKVLTIAKKSENYDIKKLKCDY